MILKEVIIENYLCYYETKKFALANGLNIILGENGEGKTKFFEALEWLFNNDNDSLELLVSKKALEDKVEGESFRVRVEVVVEHYNEIKILTKEFSVNKLNRTEYSVGKAILKGIEESKNGERTQVDGAHLLERLFPAEIRRYSMFKGEEELNIFENEDALIRLINLFSNAKHYDKYELRGEYLMTEAGKAVNRESRSNIKNEEAYKKLEGEIKLKLTRKNELLTFLDETNIGLEKTKKYIQDTEKYIDNAETLEVLNTRINKYENDIYKAEGLISENYTNALFDENWILINFNKIHKEFSEKVSDLSIQRRTLQSEYDRAIGVKLGEKKAKQDMYSNLVPLPINVPSLPFMMEMVEDKLCKVCNRPAKEGSDALIFMKQRVQNFLESQNNVEIVENEPELLFKFNYIRELVNLSSNQEDRIIKLNNIKSEIHDLFEYNQARKDDVVKAREKLENEYDNRDRIIGNSSVGIEKLGVVLKNYNSWQDDIKKLNLDSINYNHQIGKLDSELNDLNEKKDKIDLSNAQAFLINTRNILRDIEQIFRETKNLKFEEFIQVLSQNSNDIFSNINVDAFTGVINFQLVKRGDKVKVKIQLLEENGDVFYSPNQSLLTSMHISILLAISKLSKEVRDDRYPILFDAPTSSFGQSKMTKFLNLIYETSNQTIILIKDYIARDENKNLYITPEFKNVKREKAFWVKLERPFDEKKLKTINTQIIEL